MIIDMVQDNVWNTPHKHIAFAVNTEGYNDAGFAGFISTHYWNALANTGEKQLGEIMSYETGKKTLHALVCHSLRGNGWGKAPEAITKCLDALDIPDNEPIAVVLMGIGIVAKKGGANVFHNLKGMALSKKSITVYTL